MYLNEINKFYMFNRLEILEKEVSGMGEWTYQFGCNSPDESDFGVLEILNIKYLIAYCWYEIKNNGKYDTWITLKNKENPQWNMSFILNPIRKTTTDYINLFYEIFFNGLSKIDGTIQEKLTEIHKKRYN